mmetsp:Transcript_41112/g.132227  ORF Transcript_41112/g.132227 Transcript_41112/m.132227 type:complete len:198 (-) Transcript_41112:94-687(-)
MVLPLLVPAAWAPRRTTLPVDVRMRMSAALRVLLEHWERCCRCRILSRQSSREALPVSSGFGAPGALRCRICLPRGPHEHHQRCRIALECLSEPLRSRSCLRAIGSSMPISARPGGWMTVGKALAIAASSALGCLELLALRRSPCSDVGRRMWVSERHHLTLKLLFKMMPLAWRSDMSSRSLGSGSSSSDPLALCLL